MTQTAPTVYVVDDDDAMRDALQQLIEGEGLRVRAYASAEAFLDACAPGQAGCLVLDIRLPGMSGLELDAVLRDRGYGMPVIYLTGHGDIPTSVQALRAGAFDFLEKPPAAGVLVRRVHDALEQDERRRATVDHDAELRARYARLTPREREVMAQVVAGRSSKQAGRVLGISHRTVDVYRQRVMSKMQARSVLELAELYRHAAAMPQRNARRRRGDSPS